jgi:hypothetical protein
MIVCLYPYHMIKDSVGNTLLVIFVLTLSLQEQHNLRDPDLSHNYRFVQDKIINVYYKHMTASVV